MKILSCGGVLEFSVTSFVASFDRRANRLYWPIILLVCHAFDDMVRRDCYKTTIFCTDVVGISFKLFIVQTTINKVIFNCDLQHHCSKFVTAVVLA